MTSFVFLAIEPVSLLFLTFKCLQNDDISSVALTFWLTSVLLTFQPGRDNDEVATVVVYVFFVLGVGLTTRLARDVVVVGGKAGIIVTGVSSLFRGAARGIADGAPFLSSLSSEKKPWNVGSFL